jgi:hypothetical protein
MKHKHHIIPRHAGGTDDASNLVELSIQEHAEAHKELFQKYGRWQDELAYNMLSGLIGKEEMLETVSLQNGKRLGKWAVETGHLAKVRSPSAGGKVGGKVTGPKNRDSGFWGKVQSLGGQSNVTSGRLQNISKLGGKVSGKLPWWNNGVVNKRSATCPGEGFSKGMIRV